MTPQAVYSITHFYSMNFRSVREQMCFLQISCFLLLSRKALGLEIEWVKWVNGLKSSHAFRAIKIVHFEITQNYSFYSPRWVNILKTLKSPSAGVIVFFWVLGLLTTLSILLTHFHELWLRFIAVHGESILIEIYVSLQPPIPPHLHEPFAI